MNNLMLLNRLTSYFNITNSRRQSFIKLVRVKEINTWIEPIYQFQTSEITYSRRQYFIIFTVLIKIKHNNNNNNN